MKKIISLISLIALSACASSTDEGTGLVRLTEEPKDCEFLYTIDTLATTYKQLGAYDYLEKSILEQTAQADAYYIVNQTIIENTEAVFGPKNTYKFKVKVYNCKK